MTEYYYPVHCSLQSEERRKTSDLWYRFVPSCFSGILFQCYLKVYLFFINSLMFWTDWGSTPKIEKSSLNGTQRVTLVTSNLQWPNGITLDRLSRLVFWVDAGTDRVESIDYHGNNRNLLYQRVGFHFFAVTFLSPYLFVSEWTSTSVFKLNASSGVTEGNVFFTGIDKLMGLVPYDSSWQLPG